MPFTFDLPVFHFATEGAEPEIAKCLFNGTRDEIVSVLKEHQRSLSTPVAWTKYPPSKSESERWYAENITGGDTKGINNPIPCTVEPHLIADKFLSQFGKEIELLSYIIPYCGGLHLLGEFLTEPEVSQAPGKRRWPPVEISEQFKAGTIQGQIMSGFAMTTNGIWSAHTWLVTADGKVIETVGPHSHFYGVRLNDEGTKYFLELNRDDRD